MRPLISWSCCCPRTPASQHVPLVCRAVAVIRWRIFWLPRQWVHQSSPWCKGQSLQTVQRTEHSWGSQRTVLHDPSSAYSPKKDARKKIIIKLQWVHVKQSTLQSTKIVTALLSIKKKIFGGKNNIFQPLNINEINFHNHKIQDKRLLNQWFITWIQRLLFY